MKIRPLNNKILAKVWKEPPGSLILPERSAAFKFTIIGIQENSLGLKEGDVILCQYYDFVVDDETYICRLDSVVGVYET